MDLSTYIRLARKWAWLVVLAAFIAGGITFILNTGTPPTYQASVLLAIGNATNSGNPNASDMQIAGQLAENYIRLLRTYEVQQNIVAVVPGLEGFPPEFLGSIIFASPLEGTTFMTITVSYIDPVMTAAIANEAATQLILQAPGLSAGEQQRLQFANEQVSQLTVQNENLRTLLDETNQLIQTTTNEAALVTLNERRTAILSQLAQFTNTIAQFTQQSNDLEQRSNKLEVKEAARIPTNARTVNLFSTTIVGALIGAALALVAIISIEYLDDVIRSSEIAVQTLGLPVLGAIMHIGKRTDKYNDRLVYNYPSMSPVAEGYRTLRTNLLFSTDNQNKGVYVITSPSPEEGKSMTTSNLAITMALAGLQVVLIDADLRRPKLHEIFQLENNVGLTTLLFAEPDVVENISAADSDEAKLPANLRQCLQNTSVPRLRVITSGFIPSNPTEILGSSLMQRWIATFRNSPGIDIVLIDSPPTLMVADSTVLAATAKADVLLVIDAGKTRRGAGIKAKERFTQLGLEVKGVILNRLNPRDETYEYTYSYGYYYTPTPKANQRGKNGGSRRDAKSVEKQTEVNIGTTSQPDKE
mgnify:CR=1 FL=1